MKYLVLLNRKFPYASGEAFIENEIDEISSFFDKVIVLPNNMTPKDKLTRKFKSDNVDVIVFEKTNLKLRNANYLVKGIFSKKDKKASGLKQKLYSGYFESASKTQAKKIFKALSKYNFTKNDEVIFYSYWMFTTAKAAVLLKEMFEPITNVKCVSRAHSFDIYEENRYLPQRELLLSRLDKVFPCSDNGTEYYQKKYPKYADKVETAYLGTYDHGECSIEPSDTLSIISCSRLAPEKRVELIANTLATLKDSGLKLSWTHLGGGEGYEHLKQTAENQLSFMETNLPGMIPNTKVYEYYKKNHYDVFLNVSSAEGLPVSIMEAASFGIPTIATNVGGSAEIIRPGVTGVVLKPDFKPSELAQILKDFAKKTPEEKLRQHNAVRKLWLEKFQAPANYAKFFQQLENIK